MLNLLRIATLQVAYEIIACFLKYRYDVFAKSEFYVFCNRIFWRFLFRFHLREEENFLDCCLSSHEHDEAVDADTDTRSRRHAVLECAQEVLVDDHRFVVTLVGETHLLLETLFLIERVVELRVSVSKFFSVDHEFKALSESWFRTMHFCEWRHFYRVVCDECRLNEVAFAEFTKDFVDELTFAHSVVNLHVEFLANLAYFVLIHAV